MFAGIVEHVGTVVGIERAGSAREGGAGGDAAKGNVRLDVELGELADGLALGASVAVNGVCLTLAALSGRQGGFDVIPETWRATNLSRLGSGDAVNLERSLRTGDRIDGHFVQGHVDAVGEVRRVDRGGGEWMLWMRVPRPLMRYIVRKGSIAIDGVSLTVVQTQQDAFSVALIPTTLERTVLGKRRAGDAVNIETDILARLVVDRLEGMLGGDSRADGVTIEKLREFGFVT